MGTVHVLQNPHEGVRIAKDLHGLRPVGHPQIKRGPRGAAILDLGQVWVAHTPEEELWVVVSFEKREGRKGTYKHDVVLTPFDRRELRYHRKLSEQTLRLTMHVWDDYIEPQVRRVESLRALAEQGGRTYQELCKFLDLNPTTGEPHPE